jgi:hypothetical protein
MKYQSVFLLLFVLCSSYQSFSQRKEISLNGIWEITKTSNTQTSPGFFKSEIQVPGLVDMAVPAIDTLPDFSGQTLQLAVAQTDVKPSKTDNAIQTIPRDESWYYNDVIYWYKRKFILNEPVRNIALLKINKAMYHTKVYVNGKFAGENLYNFSPTIVDVLPFLNPQGEENELIISVGSRNNLPATVIRGDDFEKFFFIPGIYDDVTLILSATPFISNVQVVPDIENSRLKVVAEVNTSDNQNVFDLKISINENDTKNEKIRSVVHKIKPDNSGITRVDFYIQMQDFKVWSPESPYLYQLQLSTGSDNKLTRFGMRTFETSDGMVKLNGKPYFMRGTNICIFRFFEDSERGSLPWDADWVVKLNKLFKEMNWNSMRYTIGPPPEKWYEIADSIGFLIQDEYPIWKGHVPKPDGVTSNSLANEYKAWMRERWNHPSVVIWDGQNESVYDTTAKAINMVRELDLSNRPWDNGWALPADTSDIMESHKYFFYPYFAAFRNKTAIKINENVIKDNLKEPVGPSGPNFTNAPKGKPLENPVIMNEYTWLWINRDGSPTTVTDSIFAYLFPQADTPAKRFETYAKTLAMETEYWRCHRKFAGVMYFSGLSYSRPLHPRGITSDNFSNVKNLKLEPDFVKYVRPAFNPVGIMIDFWDYIVHARNELKIPVILINDTYESYAGELVLSLTDENNQLVSQTKQSIRFESLDKQIHDFQVTMPGIKGCYKIVAEINYKNEIVKSIRDIFIEE